MHPRTLATGLLLVAVVASLAACGDDAPTDASAPPGDDAPTDAPAATETEVEVAGFLFSPSSVTVDAGSTVTFTNGDDIDHTVTAGTPGDPTGDFDLPLPEQDATADLALDTPGTYPYFCAVHTHMRGSVDVVQP